jgi:DEAD/DEAH box helicase domain-containing protein
VELSAASYRIVEQIVGYREYGPTERGERIHKVSSPAFSYQSAGLAVSYSDDLHVGVDLGADSAYEALHALEHAMLKALPLLALASPRDFSGLTLKGEGAPVLLLYERSHGGSGLTRLLYDRFDDLVALTQNVISSCPCRQGCPLCILDPSCRDEEVSKVGALEAATTLLGRAARATQR